MTSSSGLLWLAAAGVIVSAGCALSAQTPPTVVVQPGQNIQEIVVSSPEGTRFLFAPGLYRQQTIRPKNRQQFVGQDGVILNGAMELKSWTYESGLWRHEDLPEPLHFRGSCDDGGDLCGYREDLFLNDRLYRRVATLDDLGPGRWYYADRRAYLADDPTGHLVELA